jgi:glycogen synthase
LAKKQGEMAQQRMKDHFRWEQIAEQYIQAFERML